MDRPTIGRGDSAERRGRFLPDHRQSSITIRGERFQSIALRSSFSVSVRKLYCVARPELKARYCGKYINNRGNDTVFHRTVVELNGGHNRSDGDGLRLRNPLSRRVCVGAQRSVTLSRSSAFNQFDGLPQAWIGLVGKFFADRKSLLAEFSVADKILKAETRV